MLPGRKVKVANPNATEEEVAEAVESGGKNVFVDQVLCQQLVWVRCRAGSGCGVGLDEIRLDQPRLDWTRLD